MLTNFRFPMAVPYPVLPVNCSHPQDSAIDYKYSARIGID